MTFNPTTRAATFSLSARRSGGEGRGEVGSLHKLFRSLLNLTHNLFLNLSARAKQIESEIRIASKIKPRLLFVCFVYFVVNPFAHAAETFSVLNPAAFAHHIETFNSHDDEAIPTTLSNKKSWAWLQDNIPLFECPDHDVEEIYYFRWWSFRKHIKRTPRGYVITEFLPPVSHAGEFNTISCAAGFHLAEGRWLRDEKYLNDYTRFWLRGNSGKPQPHFHKFSSWFAAAAWDRYLVNGDKKFITRLLPNLVADYRVWETERQLTNGLFWQHDVKDAMEESISGSRTAQNIRPTINSYMFGNATAIAEVARLANKLKLTEEFATKADALKKLTQETLWDNEAKFFKVLLAVTNSSAPFVAYVPSNARELLGYIPWMFGLPDVAAGILPAVEPGFQPGGKNGTTEIETSEKLSSSLQATPNPGGKMPPSTSGKMPDATAAFAQLIDPQGFSAPYGLTTAERRHPEFRTRGVGTCEWDGALWPFATSQTLYALANHLRSDSLSPSEGERAGVRGGFASPITNHQSPITYFTSFLTYTHSQRANGKPFIGEYLDETTGDWINRGNRSAFYNHSTYADLLITGVIGLIPRADSIVEINPLLPPNTWDWFCLDGVKYHGHMLTVIWDKDGTRYGRGAGLRVLIDGKQIAHSPTLTGITGKLP